LSPPPPSSFASTNTPGKWPLKRRERERERERERDEADGDGDGWDSHMQSTNAVITTTMIPALNFYWAKH